MDGFQTLETDPAAVRIRSAAERGALSHALLFTGRRDSLDLARYTAAAMECGGRVVAIIPTFFSKEVINSQTVSELVRVGSLAERKERFLAEADAFVALPGGIGTIDEVSEVMAANQLQRISKPMILLNLDGYYDPFLKQLDAMRAEGFLRTDGGLTVADTIEEVFDILKDMGSDSNS